MLYMRDLDVKFIYESDNNLDTEVKQRLMSIAKKKGYNVMALGSSLDKLAEEFLSAVFYKGKIIGNSSCVKTR